jgi:hypothetical protein
VVVRRVHQQLLYCSTMTRPDIALAVGLLTRVQAWPSPDLLKRAERVAIYLAGDHLPNLGHPCPLA